MKKLLICTTILISFLLVFVLLLNSQPEGTLRKEGILEIPEYISEEDDEFEKTDCVQMIENIVIENPYEDCLYIDMNYYYKPPSIIIRNYCDFPFSIEGQEYNDLEVIFDLDVGTYEMEGQIAGESLFLSGEVSDCL